MIVDAVPFAVEQLCGFVPGRDLRIMAHIRPGMVAVRGHMQRRVLPAQAA